MNPKFNPDRLDFVSLMSAHICHDLVSPVSAIGNALSVLDDPDADDMHEDAKALVRTSAQKAWALLEYSRLAFGGGGAAPGVIDGPLLQRVVDQMFARERAQIVWAREAPSYDKDSARLLLNLILIAVEALPRGGDVTVDAQETQVRLVSEGRRARLRAEKLAALEGQLPVDDFVPHVIQPYFTGAMAREMGAEIATHVGEGRVEIDATIPARADDQNAAGAFGPLDGQTAEAS